MTIPRPRSRRRIGAFLLASCTLLAVPTLTAVLSATPSGGTTPPAPGSVVAWGDNSNGYLGNGSTTRSLSAMQPSLPAGTVITSLATGHFATFAVTSKGTVYSWGDNQFGQLGLGSATGPDTCGSDPCSTTPALMDFPSGTVVTQVSDGLSFAVALTSAGKVYAWGYNGYGELGNGSTTNNAVPGLVNLPAGVFVTAVAAAHDSAYALTSTGVVYAWGFNEDGELGNGNYTGPSTCTGTEEGTQPCATTPTVVTLPGGVTATGLSAGAWGGLVLASTGAVYAWGYSQYGEIGNGTDSGANGCTSDPCVPLPTQVQLPAGVVANERGRRPLRRRRDHHDRSGLHVGLRQHRPARKRRCGTEHMQQ